MSHLYSGCGVGLPLWLVNPFQSIIFLNAYTRGELFKHINLIMFTRLSVQVFCKSLLLLNFES